MTKPIGYEKYLELSKKYLREGEDFLTKGDYVQASEKYWGSVAEMVKALAETKGWPHHRHHHLGIAIERLIEETGDVELERLYSVAERLHANYYENFLTSISIKVCVEDAKRLIDKLEKILFS